MPKSYKNMQEQIKSAPRTWLITGVAGFIGSNLLETLLTLDQNVIGLDNFSTGFQHNLDEVQSRVSDKQWQLFTFIKGNICNSETCRQSCDGVDYVLHQAALGSVPRSIEDPLITNENNISGFLNMLVAARDAKVKRFVYAASSSTYGVNELYAEVFARTYNFKTIGLRYFNIFGQRQDPNGAYAAVIPLWFAGLIKNDTVYINGDGETSRDFCFIDNAVQANLLAAIVDDEAATDQVYNIAFSERTTLNELYQLIKKRVITANADAEEAKPQYRDFRTGDVRHSLADISKAKERIGYEPQFSVKKGLDRAAEWYITNLS